ncbi:NAD(P)-binding protein [Haematococcus lacustris]
MQLSRFTGSTAFSVSAPHRRCPTRASRPALRTQAASGYELDPDNASILVAGGGGVALHVTRRLKNMGSWVWQLQRTDVRRKEIEGMMAIVAKGDALVPADLEKVMASIEEVDAVVCTLGGSTANPEVDSQGNINMIQAALKKGVKKFVLVTSLGCGETKDAIGEKVYSVLKPVLVEKDKAEAALMAQDQMAWTIIRPGGLTNDPASNTGVLTESVQVAGSIGRDDVALLAVKALFSKKADGKVLSAVDSNKLYGTPTYEPFKP